MKTSVTSTCALALGFLLLAGCSSDDSSNGFGNDSGVVGDDDSGSPQPGPDATTGDDAGPAPDANPGTPDSSGDDTGEAGTVDAGHDAGPSDAGHDAGPSDAGHDAGPVDAGHDAGPVDAGHDAAVSDAAPDATTTDASVDAATTDAGTDDGGTTDAGDASTSGPTIIGAWNFNEGTGTSSADLSGNGHPAVFSATGASWGTGKQGKGLQLDGAAGYADIGLPLIDTTGSFSVVGWMNLNVVNNWEILASEDDVNGSLFGLKLRGDNSNQFDFDVETSDVMNPGFAVAQSTTTATASVWVHLAGVHDASGTGTLKVYVNGTLEATTAVGQALLGATGHFLIGRGLYNGGVGSFVNGTIDEVAVYNGALTDAQVGALYTAQK